MWQKIKNIYHLLIALFANAYYGFPSKKLTVIGVTGTDGKTTTVSLIYHVLKEAGKKVSMISTIGAFIENKTYETGFHVTTPSSFALQRFIRESVRKNDKYLVLEVTSHALDQNRVFGVKFDVAVLTNVAHEHLDYHKTYMNYLKTKLKLLKISRVSVVNRDDESYGVISNFKFRISNKLITYGIREKADITPKVFPFKTKLIGEFNRYNILAGISVCKLLGLVDDEIRKGIKTFNSPPGRQEVVYKNDFSIMIDFAHTPQAFKKLLNSLRPRIKGRIIHVFGAAGKRDLKKRPLMGKISSEYSNIIILTAEDPRSEPAEKIINEIDAGIKIANYKSQITNKSKFKIYKIPNRQKAISMAIKMASKGDLVLITGKAHEKSMNYDGKKEIPWDEYEVVRNALKT